MNRRKAVAAGGVAVSALLSGCFGTDLLGGESDDEPDNGTNDGANDEFSQRGTIDGRFEYNIEIEAQTGQIFDSYELIVEAENISDEELTFSFEFDHLNGDESLATNLIMFSNLYPGVSSVNQRGIATEAFESATHVIVEAQMHDGDYEAEFELDGDEFRDLLRE